MNKITTLIWTEGTVKSVFEDGTTSVLFPVPTVVAPEVIDVPLDTPIELHEEAPVPTPAEVTLDTTTNTVATSE